jgi:hypothetical protein
MNEDGMGKQHDFRSVGGIKIVGHAASLNPLYHSIEDK